MHWPFSDNGNFKKGEHINYGTIYPAAYGTIDNLYLQKYGGNNFLFGLMDTTDEREWEKFHSQYKNLINTSTASYSDDQKITNTPDAIKNHT